MIGKQFIVDDINDFFNHSKSQYIYFDRVECKTILDAIEKAYKYEKMKSAWEEVMTELKNIYSDESENQYGNGIHKAIDIINQKLSEIEEVR